jgi:excisionase family DNA binding protein
VNSDNSKKDGQPIQIILVLNVAVTEQTQRDLVPLFKALSSFQLLPACEAKMSSPSPMALPTEDRWLDHNEAAAYLGLKPSTLYKKVSAGEIEHRKYCGRSKYQQSELDHFKNEQIRPARKRGRIPAVLGSGK